MNGTDDFDVLVVDRLLVEPLLVEFKHRTDIVIGFVDGFVLDLVTPRTDQFSGEFGFVRAVFGIVDGSGCCFLYGEN